MIHQEYTHINQILPSGRTDSNLFQKVKHLDELSGKGLKYIESAKSLIVQKKEDGVHCAIVVQPYFDTFRIGLFSRTGKAFTCVQPLVVFLKKQVHEDNLRSGVYFGELVNEYLTLEELSGLVNPNRTKEPEPELARLVKEFQIRLFDHVTLAEYLDGHSSRPYWHRLQACETRLYTPPWSLMRQVDTMVLMNLGEADRIFNEWVSAGHEGVVIRNEEAPWQAGHKGHNAIKRVRAVSYDLLCIGAESGKGKREGIVAKLLFRWRDGKTLKADLGKGWTDDKRPRIEDSETLVGGVYRVYGLQDSSKGLIRLAKVGERRIDKTEPDY